jgi:hypothetical protein
MTMTLTTAQIGSALERTVRLLAAVTVAVYVAGCIAGRFLHRLNDWVASATHNPAMAAGQVLTAILPPAPQPAAAMLLANGAILLTPEDLDREIELFEEPKKPISRRKPATVRKAKAAA